MQLKILTQDYVKLDVDGNVNMIPMLSAIAPLAKILFNTIEKAVPDKDLQERLKAQLNEQLLKSSTEEGNRDGDIIIRKIKAFLKEKQIPKDKIL